MLRQKSFLFEAPAAHEHEHEGSYGGASDEFELEGAGEYESLFEWELHEGSHHYVPTGAASFEMPSYYGTAESFYPNPELDPEYRRQNQKFRKTMAQQIATTPNHPLAFLVKWTKNGWRLKGAKGVATDAGHVIPVAQLKKMNATKERLMLQNRALNRSLQATRIKGVDIKGVPVEVETLKKWARLYPHLRWWAQQAARMPSQGWATKEGEASFLLGETHDWLVRPAQRYF